MKVAAQEIEHSQVVLDIEVEDERLERAVDQAYSGSSSASTCPGSARARRRGRWSSGWSAARRSSRTPSSSWSRRSSRTPSSSKSWRWLRGRNTGARQHAAAPGQGDRAGPAEGRAWRLQVAEDRGHAGRDHGRAGRRGRDAAAGVERDLGAGRAGRRARRPRGDRRAGEGRRDRPSWRARTPSTSSTPRGPQPAEGFAEALDRACRPTRRRRSR